MWILPKYLFKNRHFFFSFLKLINRSFLRQQCYLSIHQKAKTEVKATSWYSSWGKLLYPRSMELEILRSSPISRTRVVIHMHGSFFPSVGPLSCVEISSLGVTDCRPGLPAGAQYQSWRWFRQLVILAANYLVPPCPWLSSG